MSQQNFELAALANEAFEAIRTLLTDRNTPPSVVLGAAKLVMGGFPDWDRPQPPRGREKIAVLRVPVSETDPIEQDETDRHQPPPAARDGANRLKIVRRAVIRRNNVCCIRRPVGFALAKVAAERLPKRRIANRPALSEVPAQR
jgi:hypothetical protein